jgi:Cdc6-like AAA superfamily ATPase
MLKCDMPALAAAVGVQVQCVHMTGMQYDGDRSALLVALAASVAAVKAGKTQAGEVFEAWRADGRAWQRRGIDATDFLTKVFAPAKVARGAVARQRWFVLLDEMDGLLAASQAHQQVLCQLFAWAAAPNSRLTLLGVANAIDIGTCFLPQLH